MFSNIKILHVIAQMPYRTGSGVYYVNVIEKLKKYGYEQAALYASQDDCQFTVLGKEARYPVYFKSEHIPFPIAGMSDVMPYDNTTYSEMNEEMLGIWRGAFEKMLNTAKKEFAPDIIITHHLWMLTSIVAEIFQDRIKIGICHNTDIRQAERHPEMRYTYIQNLKQLDAVFSLSESQQQKITDTFGISFNKIKTIGGGFDEKLFFPAEHKKHGNQIQIVYSAKVERSKGIYELIEAFKRISAIKSNIHLFIIGIPNMKNSLILNKAVGDADNITVVPIKSQEELACYIRDMDLFIMPSYFEGLGLMAIESLASGLRVVATEIEGLMSLLGEKVNTSGVIEYVKLPRIYDTDKPFEEDIDLFVENLSTKMLKQIDRIERGEDFPKDILAEINKHSWSELVGKINNEIVKYLF